MNTSNPISINSPADLAAAVPYLIGYHPDNELVTVGYTGSRFALGGTVTLADAAASGYAVAIGSILRSRGIRKVLLIAYGPEYAVTPVMEEAKDACTRLDILIGEALRIDDGCWWSYLSPDIHDGTAIVPDSAIAAAFVAAGRAPLASPDAVSAQLAAVTGRYATDMNKAVSDAENDVWRRRISNGERTMITEARRLVGQLTTASTVLGTADTALLGVLLVTPRLRITVRADAIAAIDDAVPARAIPAWTGLTRVLPDSCRWQAANLTAYAAWRCGDGVLARDAIQLSLSIKRNGDNAMGHLMHRILATGTAPSEVPELARSEFNDPDTPVGS